MDLTISSEKIDNPLLVELLRKLTDSFSKMDKEFRNAKTSKDAEDMSFILSNYFMANLDREIHQFEFI